jgi:hypothetical protein
VRDAESGRFDQRPDRPIEVAAASDPFPERGQPVLPSAYAGLRRPTVLDEQQLAARLENAPHLVQCLPCSGYRAQGPGRQDGVDASVVERYRFGRAVDEVHLTR